MAFFSASFDYLLFEQNVFLSSRPTYGTPKVLERAGLTMNDIDVFEFHEAFAVSYHNILSGKKKCVVVVESA